MNEEERDTVIEDLPWPSDRSWREGDKLSISGTSFDIIRIEFPHPNKNWARVTLRHAKVDQHGAMGER
jgi:hypothetical protein